MRLPSHWGYIGAAAIGCAALGATALLPRSSGPSVPASLTTSTTTAAAAADQAALTYVSAHYAGSGTASVLKTEADTEKGVPVFDVRVLAPNGTVYVAHVNRSTDVVISVNPAEVVPVITATPTPTPASTTTPAKSDNSPDHTASTSKDSPDHTAPEPQQTQQPEPKQTAQPDQQKQQDQKDQQQKQSQQQDN